MSDVMAIVVLLFYLLALLQLVFIESNTRKTEEHAKKTREEIARIRTDVNEIRQEAGKR